MLTIWKYPLNITDQQTVWMPRDAVLLSVHEQQGQLCLWALVDPDNHKELRTIRIHGTGHPMWGAGANHFIGTVVMPPGNLVWHVFSVVSPEF